MFGRWQVTRIQLIILAGMVLASQCERPLLAEDLRCFDQGWPSEKSDLQPDDSIVRGYMENGMRYILKKNKEPERRVAVYLYIQAGSLHEKEKERGIAHFLEHLMFNGSTNFPPGSLVDYLQENGMDFGRDTNAFTSFDKTVYQLILPTGGDEDLDTGMRVVSDYARGALLLATEIEKERGVIFSEKKERDSADYRTHVASSAFNFRGTRYPDRMVIGTDETLAAADRSVIKSFYNGWYRPENMILVVVGDFEMQLAKRVVSKYFSGLQAEGERPECPEFGQLEHHGVETFYHFEPEIGHTTVSLQTYWDKQLENDSRELQKKDLVRIMSNLMVGYRLQKLLEEKEQPFVNANYHSGDIFNRIGYGSLVVQTESGKWKQSLLAVVEQFNRINLYGFTVNELTRAGKEVLAELENAVKTEDSIDSRRIARRIIDHIADNRVYMNVRQEQNLYAPMVKEISVEDVNNGFRSIWSRDSRLVSITGNVKLSNENEKEILAVYREGLEKQVVAQTEKSSIEFPYIAVDKPQKGEIQTTEFPEIDVTRYVLPNGLVINLKKTDFDENVIHFAAAFGNGELEKKMAGEAFMAEDIVNFSGSNKLPPSEIDSIVAGSSVDVKFAIGGSTFSWTGSALTEDFELSLQLLHTLLLDEGFRKIAYDKVRKGVELMYERLNHEISGAMPLKIQPFLANNNIHFGLPALQDILKLSYRDLKSWAESKIVVSDLEISVVGDFDRESILNVIAKYLGGIEIPGRIKPETETIKFPEGQFLDVKVASSIEKSLVTVAWPTDDFWNINRTRRLNVLAKVFEERVRKVVREELGVSYSPQVLNYGSRVFDGYGYIIAQLTVQQGSEEEVIEHLEVISKSLYDEGVGQAELERVKKPMITSILDSVKTNDYWLYSVLLGSSRHPVQLQWPTTIVEDFKSITTDELSRLARKYLINEKAAKAEVIPKKVF